MSKVQALVQEAVIPDRIKAGNPRQSLAAEVAERSRTDLNRCCQCGS